MIRGSKSSGPALSLATTFALVSTPALASYDPIYLWYAYAIFLVGFVLPTFIAFFRGHPNRWVILGLNIFLGATGIVWFGCLIWSLMSVHKSNAEGASNGGESGLNIFVNDPVRVATVPSPLPPPLPRPDDLVERLERLHKLLKDGAIEQEQYERMRARLLDSSARQTQSS